MNPQINPKLYKIYQVQPDLFPKMVQYINGSFYDGNGNLLNVGSGSGFQGFQGLPGSGGGGSGYQGPIGPQGLNGAVGPQGPASGAQGFQGSVGLGVQGNQGTIGLQGFQGLQGTIGLQGNQGSQGNQGTIGLQGNQGSQGNQGTIGLQGNQGSQGNQGTIGLQGNQGFQGLQGTIGAQGFQGLQGTIGLQGNQGYQGNIGLQGNQGTQGDFGSTGSQGVQGSGFNYLGVWSGTTHGYYVPNDVVEYNGSTYICISPVYGNTPPPLDLAWLPYALSGNQGFQGIQGIIGSQGSGLQGLQGIAGSGGTYSSSFGPTISVPYTVGGITAGTLVNQLSGSSVNQVIDQLLFPNVSPTFISPSYNLGINLSSLQIIGTTVSTTLTGNYNPGSINQPWTGGSFQNFRGGTSINYNFISINQSNNSYTFNLNIIPGYDVFTSSVTYATGSQPLDNKFNNYGSRLVSGILNSSVQIEGVYPIYSTTTTITSQDVMTASMITGNNIQIQLATQSSNLNVQKFWLPSIWVASRPLFGIYTFVSTTFSTVNTINSFSSSVASIGSVSYQQYAYNGVNRGTVLIKITF